MSTTLGRELLREALPESKKAYADMTMDKSTVHKLATEMAQEDPDGYIDNLQKLNDLGRTVVTAYGRDAAISLKDLRPGPAVEKARRALRIQIARINADDSITTEQKSSKLLKLASEFTDKVKDLVKKDATEHKSAFANQILSGSRGNPTQLMQILFGDMLMVDAMDRPIPYIGTSPYSAGADPLAYWVGASSARKGYVATQFATAQSGYLGNQITNITHTARITEDDCGTKNSGLQVSARDNSNIGALLLKPYKGHPANTIITRGMLQDFDDSDNIVIRSPVGCLAKEGVCKKCAGLGTDGKFHEIGEYQGINAAKTFVEPLTQASVGSKHAGGVISSTEDGDEDEQASGFRAIEQFVTTPSTFMGAAILAPTDGTIEQIREAPQGGTYVTIGKKMIYVPQKKKLTVTQGQKIYAGDTLSSGTPNPMELVRYKGIGAGRKYFLEKYGEILKASGAGTDRRNLEMFTRSMINKVRITDPKGYNGHIIGDLVNYDQLARSWQPRENSTELKPSDALGKYLEQPILHYTVGTKITPEVVDTLTKNKTEAVLTNTAEPPFQPEFIRSQYALKEDADWMARLSGERLKDSLFDAAAAGSSAPVDSASVFTRIALVPYK